MRVEVLGSAAEVAAEAAARIAAQARAAVAARGRFVLAVSGGKTPWAMLRALGGHEIPWEGVHVAQVDERVAPEGHADRNLTQIRASLIAEQIHAMPVEASDLELGAAEYARTLAGLAGSPPVLDLVHLGLGTDGHTASLVPGDPVLDVTDADVATTRVYQGRRRMTLTYPLIDRARRVLWVVTGAEKAEMLARLCDEDRSIPAGRVRQDEAVVLADAAAGRNLRCNSE